MTDLLAVLRGEITPEEYLFRRVQKQSVSEWLADYERAIKNPPEQQLNMAGFEQEQEQL